MTVALRRVKDGIKRAIRRLIASASYDRNPWLW